MGFLTPGKSSKRRKQESGAKGLRKRSKRSCLSKETTPEEAKSNAEDDKMDHGSILERFPTEILHEIFIFARMNELPFVCKTLNRRLRPSRSLCVQMLQNYVFDLNREIDMDDNDYKKRYALDEEVLRYRFVTADILSELKFDTVLPLSTIMAESKNRLILYYDKLNKKLLETMSRAEASEEEISSELARMAEERFDLNDVELSDLPVMDFQDYNERFYKGPFNEERLLLIEELHKKEMRFTDGNQILVNALRSGCGLETLDRLLRCTETGKVCEVETIIEAFEQNNLKMVDWLLDNMGEDDLLTHDDLWIYISQKKNLRFLHHLESRGGVPSHEVLGLLH